MLHIRRSLSAVHIVVSGFCVCGIDFFINNLNLKQVLRAVFWPLCKDRGGKGGLNTTLDYVKNFWLKFWVFFPFGSSHHLENVDL